MKNINNNKSDSVLTAGNSLICALLVIFFASGCATGKLGTKSFSTNFYPSCYQPVSELREDAKKLGKNVLGGAVMGALFGAAAGALLGDKTEDVILGTVIGAAAGAGISYLITTEVQNKAQKERYEIYSKNLETDYKNLDSAVAAARLTIDCYKNTYNQLNTDYQAGRISKDEMKKRLQEIRDGTNDAKLILTAFHDAAGEQVDTYAEIVKMETARKEDKLPAKSVGSIQGNAKKLETKREESGLVLAEIDDHNDVVNDALNNILTAMAPSDLFALTAALDSGPSGRDGCSAKI
jgi:uncharacterized protein YcfJ